MQALYAKHSANAGDLTGVFNQDRFAKALEDASAGSRSYRGSKFIAPLYGANDGDTDAAIRSLTEKDFADARTSDGKPFPAAALKPSFADNFTWNNWRLQSAGDGKSLVFSGGDMPGRRQYLGAVSHTNADQRRSGSRHALAGGGMGFEEDGGTVEGHWLVFRVRPGIHEALAIRRTRSMMAAA